VTSALPSIHDIRHVHVWMLTAERTLMTLHAELAPGADHQQALRAIREVLEQRFGITHATIQIETAICADQGPEGHRDPAKARPSQSVTRGVG
jgi:cobalt-zinc-cadmium efflux system protein